MKRKENIQKLWICWVKNLQISHLYPMKEKRSETPEPSAGRRDAMVREAAPPAGSQAGAQAPHPHWERG